MQLNKPEYYRTKGRISVIYSNSDVKLLDIVLIFVKKKKKIAIIATLKISNLQNYHFVLHFKEKLITVNKIFPCRYLVKTQ